MLADVETPVEPKASKQAAHAHARSALAAATAPRSGAESSSGADADKRKGRGGRAKEEEGADDRYAGKSGNFDTLDTEGGGGPQRCTSFLRRQG